MYRPVSLFPFDPLDTHFSAGSQEYGILTLCLFSYDKDSFAFTLRSMV